MNAPLVWLTGLPSSGKTTLARAVKRKLDLRNVPCCLLDSDEVRDALSPRPGYDPAGRAAFYATLAALAALLSRQGLVTLVSATAHQRAYRESARAAAEWVVATSAPYHLFPTCGLPRLLSLERHLPPPIQPEAAPLLRSCA